jgi:hypothetical protein
MPTKFVNDESPIQFTHVIDYERFGRNKNGDWDTAPLFVYCLNLEDAQARYEVMEQDKMNMMIGIVKLPEPYVRS